MAKLMRSDWWRCTVLAALLFSVWPAWEASAEDRVNIEYARRFRSLDNDDLEGHFQLALWCKEQDAYRLALKQCDYILRKKKDHSGAKLLRRLAMKKLAAARPDAGRSPGGQQAAPGAPGRILTDQEVQLLRRRELHLDRAERITVKLHNDVAEAFLEQMENDPGFQSEYSRADFLRLRPPERAQVILRYAPDTFGPDLEITADPQRFRTFQRQVLPVVLSSCGTSGCHSGATSARWRLHTGRRLTANQVYTNYLIMHEFDADNEWLINRDLPELSQLLSYGLPPLPEADLGPAHPSNHPIEIDPPFGGADDRKYRQILDWIKSLSVPAPDYGITLNEAKPHARP